LPGRSSPARLLFAFGLLALGVAFFPALSGQIPAPASSAVLLLPDGPAPPEINELSDVPTEFLPWSRAVAQAYRGGRLPFRLAANGCGTPLWANPQAQAVTPTTLLYLLLPEAWGSAASGAVKLFLGAAGALLFLRQRGLSLPASGWAGFAYGFSLSAATWLHFPHTYPYALLPWALWALERLARGKPGGFRSSLAVVFLLLLGGYPEGELYVAAAGLAYFLALVLRERVAAREKVRRLSRAVAASLLALGLSAAYLLPATLAIVRGERSAQVQKFPPPRPTLSVSDFLRPPLYWDVARFWVVPEAQGNPRDQDKFGPYSFAGRTSGYAGILILALALACFFWRRAPAGVRWARRGAVFLALYVTWYPPLQYLVRTVPGLRTASLRLTTNRATAILILLLGFLAASMLDRLRRGERTGPVAAVAAALLLALVLVAGEYFRQPGRPPFDFIRAARFLVPLLLLLVALLLPLLGRGGWARAALPAFLAAGTAIDLLRLGARFNPGTLPEHYYPETPAVQRLQRASEGGRFAASAVAMTGLAPMYGLQDVAVHDPVAPSDYQEVLAAAAGYTGPGEYLARVTRLDAPLLDFLNVRARLLPGREGAIRASASSPAFLPERLVGVGDRGELLRRVSTETDFTRSAYALGPSQSFRGSARIVSFERRSPEEIRVRVSSDHPRLLAVPESNDGGWTCRADGRRLPTLVVNGAFLGVRIPAGETTIVCRYTPPGFREGAVLTGVSLFVAIGLVARRRSKRSSTKFESGAAI
jgi:hypothetical protein